MITQSSLQAGTASYCVIVCNQQTAVQIIGTLLCYDENHNLIRTFRCLELPDKNNKVRESCIPIGTYKASLELHTRFGRCARINNVDDRKGILIHVGNFYWQTFGCVLIGLMLSDIDKDGNKDVIQSMSAMQSFYSVMQSEFSIKIIEG